MSEAIEQNPEIQESIQANAQAEAAELGNEIIDQADETVQSVNELKSEWERYYARQGHARMQKITQLAGQDDYEIELQVPAGPNKKIKNPFTGLMETEYTDRWEKVTYIRRKISHSNWLLVEKARARFAREKDTEKRTDLYSKLYEGLAYLYLQMKPEDFKRSDWEKMKLILDACNHRTIYGLPSQARPSTNSSTRDGVG